MTKPKAKAGSQRPKKLPGKCVYLLRNELGEPKYVGVTQYPQRRFNEHCARLDFAPTFEILELSPPDWEVAEQKWIAHFRALGPMLNIAAGGLDMAHASPNRTDKPWVAGRGILAPSAVALQRTPKASKPAIRASLRKMTVAERCRAEMAMYQSFPPGVQNRLARWAQVAWPKMSEAVDQNYASA